MKECVKGRQPHRQTLVERSWFPSRTRVYLKQAQAQWIRLLIGRKSANWIVNAKGNTNVREVFITNWGLGTI